MRPVLDCPTPTVSATARVPAPRASPRLCPGELFSLSATVCQHGCPKANGPSRRETEAVGLWRYRDGPVHGHPNARTKRATVVTVTLFHRSIRIGISPDTPVMNARLAMRRWKQPLIPSDDSPSAGGHQIAAELLGLFSGAERADHGAVGHALVAEIDAIDHRRAGAQHARELVLQCPVGGLRISLVRLPGDL
jgi:hypothetical protein